MLKNFFDNCSFSFGENDDEDEDDVKELLLQVMNDKQNLSSLF